MSFKAIGWALNKNCKHPTSKLVLILLANYCNEDNECYPSQEHIAKRAGCSCRCVIDHIKKLVVLKLIVKIKIRKGKKYHNRYRLMIPKDFGGENTSHNTNIILKNKNFLAG